MAKKPKNLPVLTESEWLIMARLWKKFPLIAAELVDMELNGKKMPNATVRTLLRHLVEKKVVDYTVDKYNAKLYHYFPLVSEQDYMRQKNKHILESYYHNNAQDFFAAFMDDTELSSEDIAFFQKLLDAKKEGNL